MASEEMEQLVRREYKDGFVTDIESDTLPPGLDENTIAFISTNKGFICRKYVPVSSRTAL